VVAFSVVQYATGTRVDTGRVAERAHEVGARVVVDATQLAGAGSSTPSDGVRTRW
jgi:cysteine desulfurase / selenocysteine lyase